MHTKTNRSKGLLETGITSALESILNNNTHLQKLITAITDTYNKNLYNITGLRLAEKELSKIHTSTLIYLELLRMAFTLILQI